MHIDMTRGRLITCSKCGSTNAIKPVNRRDVEIQCGDCGHTKLTREAESRQWPDSYKAQAWIAKDEPPTF